MQEYRILSPCGMLGYGFPLSSFEKGMAHQPHAIAVDAGSTDGGPHKLGMGTAIVSRQATKKDLTVILLGADKANIPVLIGSAGGSGGRKHVLWTKEIVDEILKEQKMKGKKVAIIWADIPKKTVAEKMQEGKLQPLGRSVGELTVQKLEATTAIVAQMGHEPIIKALENKADIIIAGRAYDPSPFAAPAIFNGFNPAYAYHAGKILECAALCAEPGTTKDCVLGIIKKDGFIIKPLNKQRRCTATSVAAHTFYEKAHPYLLPGPGHVLNLQNCRFVPIEEGAVKVYGSEMMYDDQYRIKMEGAMEVAYRTIFIAGIRDELMIARIDEIEQAVEQQVREYYQDISAKDYSINFRNYGYNGVLGDKEPCLPAHEIGIVAEVLAKDQEMANMVCASVRSTLLHYGYEGRKSTAGNLAFPFAPSDIPFGPVYEFSVYHLMDVDDGCSCFPLEYYFS